MRLGAIFRRRTPLHIVRDDGAAVRPIEWVRWIFVAGVLAAAAIAWLVRHGR